jgi:hypothetical protein
MSRASAWTLALVAFVLLCMGVFFATFERKDVDVDVPPSGKAATNKFYALEQAMRRMGVAAHSVSGIPAANETLIVLGVNPANLDRYDVDDLLDGVSDGKHLVVRTGLPSEVARAAFWKSIAKSTGFRLAGEGCLSIQGQGAEKPYTWCGQRVTATYAARGQGLGDTDAWSVLNIAYGDGTITLVPSLDPFTGRGLDNPVVGRLVVRLLNLDDTRQVAGLVYRIDGDRIWSLLFTRGWPGMIAFAVLLLAWAVSRAVRLGPLLDAARPDRRALVEHVQAAGEFLYRRDRGRGLHARVCAGVLARARRLDPATDDLEGKLLYARLAERFDETPADIARAFRPPADATAFRESVAILSRLRRHA